MTTLSGLLNSSFAGYPGATGIQGASGVAGASGSGGGGGGAAKPCAIGSVYGFTNDCSCTPSYRKA